MERSAAVTSAVVFDLDGTLFDLNLDLVEFKKELAEVTGFNGPVIQMIEMLDRSAAKGYLKRLTEIEVESVNNGCPLPFAVEMLTTVRRAMSCAVVSRNSRECIAAALDVLGTPGLITVGREDVAALKPDPQGALLALGALGVEPEAAVVVGDTFHDVEMAHSAGMRCVVVANSRLAYAPEGGDHYIGSLAELSGVLGLLGAAAVKQD